MNGRSERQTGRQLGIQTEKTKQKRRKDRKKKLNK